MRLSKPIQSEKAQKTVLEYRPPKIDRGVPSTALESYERTRTQGSDFRMSEIIRLQTGLNQIEETNFEEEVEKKTLERLKEVQESAYQEAYQLGLQEGKKEAFEQASALIDQQMKELGDLIDSILKMKTELLAQNERHLVELAFHMAQRLAAYEISVDPAATLSIVRQAVEMAQSEEKIVVQVNPSQIEYFETLRNETGRDFEFLKKIKLEPNDQLKQGGCVVISNYGEVDSRFEERVKKLWSGLEEVLPRLKQKLSVAG
jgi:flagellar assembly protein FliH